MVCMCTCQRRRYLVAILAFFGLLLSVGFRADFSLVMTHITRYNNTNNTNANVSDEQDFFLPCPSYGSPRDWEVNWSQERVQLIHTTYFAGTLITQLPGGALAARFSPKKLSGIMILCSSLLFIILPSLAKVHWGFLFVIRGLQGLLEGGSVPALAGVISAWAPRSERSRLLAIAFAGAYLSPAAGFIFAGLSTCLVSWDSIFYICGGLGVVWFTLWMYFVHGTPESCPYLSESEQNIFIEEGPRVKSGDRAVAKATPWRRLFTSLPVLAIFVGAFCRNWIFSMMITQQPQYFKDSFKMRTADIGLLSAIPPVLMTVVVIAGSVVFDKLITKNYVSRTVGRKLAQTLGFGTEAICVLCLYFADNLNTALVLLCVGVGFSGFAISGYQVNPLDLSPQYASLITGIGRVGTIGSVLSTIVASQVIQFHTEKEWKSLWLSAGIIHLVGVILYDFLASGNIQPWDPFSGRQAEFQVTQNGLPYRGCERDPLLAKPKAEEKEDLEDSLILG